jgi:hypothetical protein
MYKTIKEFKHVAGTTAKALIYEGKPAGRIIANWSDNPAGTVCSASVIIWAGPLKDAKHPKTGKGLNYGNIGKAGGYGYDKLSQAVYNCLVNAGVEPETVKPGNGQTDEEFTNRGYVIFDIC